jgi:hypothetical protein
METATEWNWFLMFTPTQTNQVLDNHLVYFNSLCGTMNASRPHKADNKAIHGWWKYWRQQSKHFLQGAGSKIKDQDWQKILDLYYAGIFSGISFNGLPSRMYELPINQGVYLTASNCTLQGQ